MKKNHGSTAWTKYAVLSAVAFCVAGTAAHAQTVTAYATGFDGTDTTNGNTAATTYNSPPGTPTDPLDGQNNWGSNDPTNFSTPPYGTSTQLAGGSDFVGASGFYTGQTAVLGGIYRTTSPTAGAPDVVPSTASGGIVSLYHPVMIGAGASFIALNTDFAVTAPVNFAARDTFSFSLQSTAFASLITINFQPSISNPATMDEISYTIGGTTTTTGQTITLNGIYHLALTVTPNTNSFIVQTTQIGGTNPTTFTFGGSLNGATINPASVGEFAALWNLQNKTVTAVSGTEAASYQGAGDNTLVFDNLAITVPEPSTYVTIMLGLAGLIVPLRLVRKRI